MRRLFFGAVLTATALAAVPSYARDRDRGRDTFTVTPNQVVDIADARVAALKADLRLTSDQDKNWGSFQSSLHDMAQRRADRMVKMREQRSAQSDPNAPVANDPNAKPGDARDARARNDRVVDLPTNLRNQADALTNKADDLRKFADAAGPLYSSLDDRQRDRFMGFVRMSTNDDPDARGGFEGRRGRY